MLRESEVYLQGSMRQVEVVRSFRLALSASFDLNRYTLPALCENLLGAD
jgi:hypothetical protein